MTRNGPDTGYKNPYRRILFQCSCYLVSNVEVRLDSSADQVDQTDLSDTSPLERQLFAADVANAAQQVRADVDVHVVLAPGCRAVEDLDAIEASVASWSWIDDPELEGLDIVIRTDVAKARVEVVFGENGPAVAKARRILNRTYGPCGDGSERSKDGQHRPGPTRAAGKNSLRSLRSRLV